MRITDIITETTAGAVAGVAMGLGGGDPAASIYKNTKKKAKKSMMVRRPAMEGGRRKPCARGQTKYVEVGGKNIPIAKYGFGWAVVSGKYQGIGSFSKRNELIAAITSAMEKENG